MVNDFIHQLISNIDELRLRMSHLESIERPNQSSGTWANRPTLPSDGELYLATDRTTHYTYYTAGSFWASQPIERALTPYDFSNASFTPANLSTFKLSLPLPGDYSLLVERISVEITASAAQDGGTTNYITLNPNNAGISGQAIKNTNQAAGATNGYEWTPLQQLAPSSVIFLITATVHGAVGTINATGLVRYRLLG